ncbi:hypothetical protein K504DRAFT_465051 [Pleomassaria siparia CBS 279.74]|uniref:peptidylprolyl isomerase n=1 Tax=Pleomassaria siparia CBS 279.74 TaxID=1314801 RepID=A0A6G1KET0_9PLEO|nr:hypothetical protein K504DRAFT_465051 [Pleomassaria siparia CBS 279.74]
MSGMLPMSVFGLRVPAGLEPVSATLEFPASFRITMAALDPTAIPQLDDNYKTPRATLKLLRQRRDPEMDFGSDDGDDEDMDDDDIAAIKARLAGIISEEDDSDISDDDSEEEKNGGPSDPVKAKQAKQAALTKKLQEELDAEEMEVDSIPNGVNGKSSKGKAKAIDGEISSDDDDEDLDSEGDEVEEFVLCTLDPEKNYQQTLDITVGEHEEVYFTVSGTHDIFITGNYVIPPDELDEDSESDDEDYDGQGMEYDLSPDEDELDISESEDDVLDGLKDPRITEVESDEEEAPKLVSKKGKNKRPAESLDVDDSTLDALISKAAKSEEPTTNGEAKLSKKQAKKLKKNDGQAVAAAQESAKKEKADKAEAPGSDKKKVQFAKNLELGPTGSPKVEEKKEAKKEVPKGPRVVGGVTVEDKKEGKGRAAKKGDKIEMRYIGKLKNGKQFDSNKKGKPFSFKLGVGEVIKGWDIGVVGMTAGSERRLSIPAKLAYGNKALPDIPANSELIFDIKCISVS